jgi:hypothetical protein
MPTPMPTLTHTPNSLHTPCPPGPHNPVPDDEVYFSPSPTTKVCHGHTGALPFHCSQKNFLLTKSPPSTSSRSSKSPGKLLTMSDHRTSTTMSTVSSPQSMHTMLGQPSLKSQESTVSMGSPGLSSCGSMNGDARAVSDADVVDVVQNIVQHYVTRSTAFCPSSHRCFVGPS